MKRKIGALLLAFGVVICQLSPSSKNVTEIRTERSAAEITADTAEAEVTIYEDSDEPPLGASANGAEIEENGNEAGVKSADAHLRVGSAGSNILIESSANEVTANKSENTETAHPEAYTSEVEENNEGSADSSEERSKDSGTQNISADTSANAAKGSGSQDASADTSKDSKTQDTSADTSKDSKTQDTSADTSKDSKTQDISADTSANAAKDSGSQDTSAETSKDSGSQDTSTDTSANAAKGSGSQDTSAETSGDSDTRDFSADTSSTLESQPSDTSSTASTEADLVGAAADEVTIRFYKDYGVDGEMPPVTVKSGSEYALPDCVFTQTGAVFYRWKVNGEYMDPGDTFVADQDTTVYVVWAEDMRVDYMPTDLSKTQIVGKIILTDKSTGEVYTETLGPDDYEERGYSKYTFIVNSSFNEPSNSQVEAGIKSMEAVLGNIGTALAGPGYERYNYHSLELDIKNTEVSDPEIVDTKVYEEYESSFLPSDPYSYYDFYKETFLPGDYYNRWQYTVTVEAEYYSYFPVTVHWSSIDGEDLMEPLVFNMEPLTDLNTLTEQAPLFVKDGYVATYYLLSEPFSTYQGSYPDLTYSSITHDWAYVDKPMDLYCVILKELPEVELTVDAPDSESDIRLLREYIRGNINVLPDVSDPVVIIDTPECDDDLYPDYSNPSGTAFANWERADSPYFAGKNINKGDLLFKTSVCPKIGYCFPEDVHVTLNGATVQATEAEDQKVSIYGSMAAQASDKEDANELTVTFNSGHNDSHGEMPAVKVKEGADYTLPKCEFTRENATFYRWKVNGREMQAGDTIVINEDTLITAVWYTDVQRAETPMDLSTTQLIGKFILTNSKTGETYTRTFGPDNTEDDKDLDYIIRTTSTDSSNDEVEYAIERLKYFLKDGANTFFDSSLFPADSTFLIKNLDVSAPEIIESKVYEDPTYTYEKSTDSDDYIRNIFIPGDHYTRWQYTVTLRAEYADHASLTVHWSSIDGDDLMEPVVVKAELNTQLSTLRDEIPAFVKDGYKDFSIYSLEPYSEAVSYGAPDWDFESEQEDFNQAYLTNDMDVYCIMVKVLPEAEITIDVPPCGKGPYATEEDVEDMDDDVFHFYYQPDITIETYECIEHLPDALIEHQTNHAHGDWIDQNGEVYHPTFIGGQDYLFTTSLETNVGYCFTEDTTIIVNGGKLQSADLSGNDMMDIVGSITVEHDPAEPVEENRVSATCIVDGSYDMVMRCRGCGEILSSEPFVIDAPGHKWNEGVVSPETGVTTYTCMTCGVTKTKDSTHHEHSWDEGIISTEPTWTEPGVKTYTCSICGGTKTEVVPALNEGWEEWNETKEDTEPEIIYEITEGGGGYFTKGEGKSLTFTFKGPVDDRETLSHFKGIRVDGSVLSVANYIAENGRVSITLKINYLETLDLGWHTITAVFDNGEDVKDCFKVVEGEKAAEKEDDSDEDDSSVVDDSSDKDDDSDVDDSSVVDDSSDKDDDSNVDDSSATEGDNTDSKDTSGESQKIPTGLPTIPITGIPENKDKNPTAVPTETVTSIPEKTDKNPTTTPTVTVTSIPKNTDKDPTTTPTVTVTSIPKKTDKDPTTTPTVTVTSIPKNTQKAPTTTPAKTITSTSSGTQKSQARTSSSRTTTTATKTSGSTQKAPTRAVTRAAATGDNNQVGVWTLLFVTALAALIYKRPGRKNN